MKNGIVWTGLLISAGMMLSACGAETESVQTTDAVALCADAQAHASACFPDESVDVSSSCDATSAEEILAKSCDDLQRASASSKADGICSPLLFWRYCNEELELSLSSKCTESGCDWDVLPGEIDFFRPTERASCFTYDIRDMNGNTVRTVEAQGSDLKVPNDLPNGDYKIVVQRRDGSDAKFLVDENNYKSFDFGYWATNLSVMNPTFSVKGGTFNKSEMELVFTPEEKNAFRTCGNVEIKAQMYCNGAVQQNVDGQFDWYVNVDSPENPEVSGNYIFRLLDRYDVELIQEELAQTMDLNLWRKESSVPLAKPGTYNLTFHQVKLTTEARNDAYRESVYAGDREIDIFTNPDYATGYTIKESVTVGYEDYTGDYGSAEVLVDIDYGDTCN